MKLKKTSMLMSLGSCLVSLLSTIAIADEGVSDAAQANNPLASMTAFNLHNYYIGKTTGSGDDANQFWMRYAKPFSLGESNWIMRAS